MKDFQSELEQDKAGASVFAWVGAAVVVWIAAIVWLCV